MSEKLLRVPSSASSVLTAGRLFKGALEHGGAIGSEPHPLLRSRTSLFPGRRIFMPFHICLHFEHHLNFNVPWYLLPRYHQQVQDIMPRPLHPFVFNRQCWPQLMNRCPRIPQELFEKSAAGEAK